MMLHIIITDKRIKHNCGIPAYETKGAAGIDLRASIDKPITLRPGDSQLISSGLKAWIKDPGYVGLVFPRSGLGHKKGIVLGNGTGVIDSDYQGDLFISLYNRGVNDVTIEPLDRVAQLLIMPVFQANIQIVEEFKEETDRGQGGLGSTGLK